jgi:hypothetical protein
MVPDGINMQDITDQLLGCDPNVGMNYKHASCDEIIEQNKK